MFPHICRVYGGCIISDTEVWIILEHIDGGNLHDFLQSSTSPLPFSLTVSLALQITQALNYLHNRPDPIIHRDTKSVNILMNLKTETIVLADFGMTQVKSTSSHNSKQIDNPRWLAPEMIKSGLCTEKADIYSLGMVFYELVARKIPFSNVIFNYQVEKMVSEGIRPEIPSDCPQVYSYLFSVWTQLNFLPL